MKKPIFGMLALVAVWGVLVAFVWFGPSKAFSNSERRALAQMPEVSPETVLGGKFMEDFEEYTLDQFPLRERFRSLKALTHNYVLQQLDNNNIYVQQGHTAELLYPLDTGSVDHAVQMFQQVYQQHLQNSGKIIVTMVPDKSYYLDGYLSLDYEAIEQALRQGMPWAEFVDITDTLTLADYYRTDTHWRQEAIVPVAQLLGQALGVTVEDNFRQEALERPFYGVYYGQAALPADPDQMVLMTNQVLDGCTVTIYDAKTGKPVQTEGIYDYSFYDSPDMYQMYLSGAQSIVKIENPNATTDKELVVFRDSFGSSLVPLLAGEYAAVTLVDIRYITPAALGHFVQFEGRDVLFMYSSLVLNKKLI